MRRGAPPTSEGLLVLLACAALGLAARNTLILGSCLVLVTIRLLRLDGLLHWLMDTGTTFGVFVLILALLAPVADEQIPLRRFVGEIFTRQGAIAVVLAAAGAWLGRYGVDYLKGYPQALVGLIVGSVLGTILLGGIPTGPLILAGLTALLAGILGR